MVTCAYVGLGVVVVDAEACGDFLGLSPDQSKSKDGRA